MYKRQPLDRQRVASPFLSTAQENLKLYKAIDHNTWGRMLGRVNGVNFTGIYGGTRAMGWQNITLPEGYTCKEYMYFLLDTCLLYTSCRQPNSEQPSIMNPLNWSATTNTKQDQNSMRTENLDVYKRQCFMCSPKSLANIVFLVELSKSIACS